MVRQLGTEADELHKADRDPMATGRADRLWVAHAELRAVREFDPVSGPAPEVWAVLRWRN